MAYTTIDNPELYFQCKAYTGNGTTQNITFDGDENMQPDFVWVKNRTDAEHHSLYDSIRGVNQVIYSNQTNSEDDESNGVSSFDSNGYGIANTNGALNGSGKSIVAWCWKAGTAWSNDASATSVGSLDSSGTKNATAGFSIISFTGTESGTPSIAHSLSSTPEFIISKALEVTDNWMVFHGSFSAQDYIILNTYGNTASASSVWNSLPSSTVINMGDNAGVNDNGTMIMYAWHGVQGFSKFGSYTGNGNADGPFVFTGFRPAFVMQKNTSATQGWQLQDNKRDGYNGNNDLLQPHDNAAESGVNRVDLLSNGFKVITTDAGQNTNGSNYVYMAFAEQPFVNSNGVPANAR